MRTRTSVRRGSMLGAMLILLAFAGMMIYLMSSLATIGVINGQGVLERDWEGTLQAWNTAVAGDALAELQAGTFQQTSTTATARRAGRITAILQPTASGTQAGISVAGVAIAASSADPWNKANALAPSPPLGLLHPWGRSPVLRVMQTVNGTLTPNPVCGDRGAASTITYGAFSASDVGLIVGASYTGTGGPSVVVHGTAILAGGMAPAAGATRLSADVVAAPSGVLPSATGGKTIYGTASAVHPFYRIGWGTSPAEICRAVNQSGSLTSQSFWDRSTAVVNVLGMASTSGLPSGVTIREYPTGSGVRRVVVDLAIIGPLQTNLYVNFIQAADRALGVAVLGAGSATAGQHAVVATNGLVRLEGTNVMPCIIASAYGQVFCEDLTAGSALSQTWVGSLFLPGTATFATGQAAAGAVLRIQGSVYVDGLAGNLPLLDITESRNGTVRNDAPRFVTLLAVR